MREDKEYFAHGAGGRDFVVGHTGDNSAECLFLARTLATRLEKKLTDVRKSCNLCWLQPDNTAQVTIECAQNHDESAEPSRLHTIVIFAQHAELLEATRTNSCAGYIGPEMVATGLGEMSNLIAEDIVSRTPVEISIQHGRAAHTLKKINLASSSILPANTPSHSFRRIWTSGHHRP